MTMNSKRTLIVLIHCGHPNDYEVAKPKRRSLAEFGFSMVDLSINDPGVVGKLNALLTERRSEIFCFLSDNYYGAGIRAGEQLLHRLTGIPIVFFLHDHPLYFLGHQSPALEGGIVFAPGPDLLDFVAKYYPADTLGVVNSAFSLPPYALGEPRYEEFVSRKNMLLCPMNLAVGGLTLDGLWRQLKELPSVRRDFALRLTETALTDCLTPLHVHAEALARAAQAEAERQSAENGELRDLLRRAMTQITHDIEDREAARLRLLASLQRSLHERHIEVTLVSVWELRESLESVSGGGLNPLKFLDSLSGIDSRGAPCGMTRTGNGTIGTSCATPAT